jgi:hypothetical protein
VLYVSDIHISKGQTPDRHCWRNAKAGDGPVRGLCRDTRRCRCGWLYTVATCQKLRPYSMDTRQAVAPGNRAATSSGAWHWAIPSAATGRTTHRCADRGGRGAALQSTCRRGGRNLGRSACAEFHRDETLGTAGRGCGGALLAGPAWGKRRSQRRTGSLAYRVTAIGNRPRRCAGPRRSALAGRSVPFPRQTAWAVGGAI